MKSNRLRMPAGLREGALGAVDVSDERLQVSGNVVPADLNLPVVHISP